MRQLSMQVEGDAIRTCFFNTIVVGTGAAGYNAADCLYANGQTDIVVVTEGVRLGTSRNTGSDKQTYYKLTLSGGDPDSVREMADTLFQGQCVDGDIALCEAALSAQGFLKLVQLGVPFPRNRYGEFIGYKTDHDPRRRATSVGPYTSKRMTECLEKAVKAKGICVWDQLQVVRVLVKDDKCYGLLCLDLTALGDKRRRFVALCGRSVVYATGGPAGMYADSVYPEGHYGSTGIAFEAGVRGKNLTEWQYGLASVQPRWNVSGTYMQVLPKFVSVGPDGAGREFLFDFFRDKGEMLSRVFLKGYQWPFDVRKVEDGSSIVDILVYLELCKGNRVYLDFRENPGGGEIDFGILSAEAREYLEKGGACFGTPLDRLLHMNRPAVEFYRDKGVDLAKEMLEIALCTQHNNGGLGIDCWWQTNIEGFFAVGEAAASHGVYRPGGSALNAGQAGSARAAQFIAARRPGEAYAYDEFAEAVGPQIADAVKRADAAGGRGQENVLRRREKVTTAMSRLGGAIRDREAIEKAAAEIREELQEFWTVTRVGEPRYLPQAFRLWDILLCQSVYLQAMLDYVKNGGKSRGSALYTDASGNKPYDCLPDTFKFLPDDGSRSDMVQEVAYKDGECRFNWRKVRPIPEDVDFFENVWRQYIENGNVF